MNEEIAEHAAPPATVGGAVRQAAGLLLAVALCAGALLAAGFRPAGLDAATLLRPATPAIALLAFVCEYVDSTLGMGYGTTLTPLLLLLGFPALDIVPCVLASELATGLLAGAFHHRAGNVDFRRGGSDLRVAGLLAACSVVGTLVAVVVAVRVPRQYLTAYIGLLVLSMGVLILVLRRREGRFSWGKLVGLGLLASFNKGMSGGGYGPVVTCGQILSGVQGKRAVGITSLAEGLTCLVGLAAYLAAQGRIAWALAVPLVVGALASVPFAALSVRRLGARSLTTAIGVTTVVLGVLALATKTFKP